MSALILATCALERPRDWTAYSLATFSARTSSTVRLAGAEAQPERTDAMRMSRVIIRAASRHKFSDRTNGRQRLQPRRSRRGCCGAWLGHNSVIRYYGEPAAIV